MDSKEVKNKYKQLKYQHLKKLYNKNLSKLPHNCKYNKVIQLPNGSRLNICGFNIEEEYSIDLCYKPEHSKNCNAFCPIRTKDQIHDDFMEDLKDDQKRATDYKDINILYWAFPEVRDVDGIQKDTLLNKIGNFFKKMFPFIK